MTGLYEMSDCALVHLLRFLDDAALVALMRSCARMSAFASCNELWRWRSYDAFPTLISSRVFSAFAVRPIDKWRHIYVTAATQQPKRVRREPSAISTTDTSVASASPLQVAASRFHRCLRLCSPARRRVRAISFSNLPRLIAHKRRNMISMRSERAFPSPPPPTAVDAVSYFEVEALSDHIDVGICDNEHPMTSMFSERGCFVLFSSNATLCRKQRRLSCTRDFGIAFARNDVIGCGIEWAQERLFFTLNGKLVGRVFSHSLENRGWFAFVRVQGVDKQSDVVNANLDGHEAFRFDVDSYISQEQR